MLEDLGKEVRREVMVVKWHGWFASSFQIGKGSYKPCPSLEADKLDALLVFSIVALLKDPVCLPLP